MTAAGAPGDRPFHPIRAVSVDRATHRFNVFVPQHEAGLKLRLRALTYLISRLPVA